MASRRAITKAQATGYRSGSRAVKSEILDAVCAVTGFNRDYARSLGHPDIVVNPHLLFNVVLGMSVEDCSEIGGPFLGVNKLVYHRPVYPGPPGQLPPVPECASRHLKACCR